VARRNAIPNQEASIVVYPLVINICFFGVPMELHSDQGRNVESRPLQEILQGRGSGKLE